MSRMRVTNTIKRTVNTGSQQSTATDANTEYVRIMSDTMVFILLLVHHQQLQQAQLY
jgi:hypothetical protein